MRSSFFFLVKMSAARFTIMKMKLAIDARKLTKLLQLKSIAHSCCCCRLAIRIMAHSADRSTHYVMISIHVQLKYVDKSSELTRLSNFF